MKSILKLITIGLISLLFACGHSNEKSNNPAILKDSAQIVLEKKESVRLEKRKQIVEQNRIDSLRLDTVLKDALKIANQNIGKDKFIEKYDVNSDSIPISVEINMDHHFTKTTPHLIIRRNEPNFIYIDIYIKNNNKFEKIIAHKEWGMTYMNDTIQDINGDGLNDFVVNWYGSSGCCMKGFSDIYLLRPNKKSFSGKFEFINPTFSPKEKVIRGVCYGHPGETEMYKYGWNGQKLDTIEYISYQLQKDDSSNRTGKIELKRWPNEELIILDNIPKEYIEIEGYSWFTGEGFE